MKALFVPDHGRAIWDEKAMPGYGLYDRAMGLTYIQGLYEQPKPNKIGSDRMETKVEKINCINN